MLALMPEKWELLDVLIWRYDISYDPGRGSTSHCTNGSSGWVTVRLIDQKRNDGLVHSILKGNSTEDWNSGTPLCSLES